MATPYPTVVGVRFKSIDRFEGYAFGSDGSAWSRWVAGHVNKLGDWHELYTKPNRFGYHNIQLRISNSKRRAFKLHRLILEAFAGSRPPEMHGRHLDGNPSNNRLENLAWGTPKQNTDDRARHGKTARGVHCGSAKLDPDSVATMYAMYEQGLLIKHIAARFGVDASMTSKILRGIYWADTVPDQKPPLLGVDARQRGAIAREQARRKAKSC